MAKRGEEGRRERSEEMGERGEEDERDFDFLCPISQYLILHCACSDFDFVIVFW